MDKKKMTLTFTEASFQKSEKKKSFITVLDVYSSSNCLQCHKTADYDAMLLLEQVPAGKSFVLKAEVYCKNCGSELLAHFNMVRECLIEGGDVRMGACLRAKRKAEGHKEED